MFISDISSLANTEINNTYCVWAIHAFVASASSQIIFSMVNSHVSVCSFAFLETQKYTSYIFIAEFLTNWSAIEISGKILS